MRLIKLLHVVFQARADNEIFQLLLDRHERVASALEHLGLRDLFREKFSLLLLQLRVQLQANFKLCLLAAQLRCEIGEGSFTVLLVLIINLLDVLLSFEAL